MVGWDGSFPSWYQQYFVLISDLPWCFPSLLFYIMEYLVTPLRAGSRGDWKKICFFDVKSWFFTRNTPKLFAPPYVIAKTMVFLALNSDFSHEIPLKYSRLPLLGAIFLSAPPLTWNPGSAPATDAVIYGKDRYITTYIWNIHSFWR